MLGQVISSKLQTLEFIASLFALVLLFISSVILYGYVTWLEQQKDTKIMDSTAQIVKYVFADYGAKVASSEYPSNVTANEMNKIMQTIVNYTKELASIGDKTYRK